METQSKPAIAGKKPAWKEYLIRAGIMAVPVFMLLYTCVFIGPLDIVNANQQFLTVTAGELFWPFLGMTLGGTVVLAALLGLCRGRAFGAVFGVITALAVMCYIQATVLDGHLATLDGSDFRWQDDAPAAWRNFAIWAAAVVVLGVVGGVFPQVFRPIGCILCAALILGQTVALIASWSPADNDSPNYQLSGEGELSISANENVLVLTLDQMNPLIFEEVLEMDPSLEETFRDFIYYDNMSASYSFTFPSLCFLLTHQHFDTTIPTTEAVYNAWHSEEANQFYETLHENNYTTRLYVESNYAAISAENMLGKADNVVEAGRLIPNWDLLESSLWMSFYRYFPTIAKNEFCVSTGQILDTAEFVGVDKVKINYDFYPMVRDEGLEIAQEENCFQWYHLQGAHFPFIVDYDGEYLGGKELEETEENRLNQLHGYLVAVSEYIQQLKDIGAYDDATIIVSSDHGYFECFQSAFLIKLPGQSFEAMQVNSAPVAQEDILPTILYAIGEDYEWLGTTVFDWNEGDHRVRTTRVWGYMSSYPDVDWVGNVNQWDAEANGFNRYNVFGVFNYDGDRDTILAKERNWYYYGVADEIQTLYDSYY